eukprot:scaffold451_cov121-Cylindrotheca_fusiformis.AAC.9
MSFLLDHCLVLNRHFSTAIDRTKDDGTVGTEASEDPAVLPKKEAADPAVLAQKATVIQSRARGMATRKKMKNREQFALDCTRSRAGHTIMKNSPTLVSIEKHIRVIKSTLEMKKDLWEQCKGSLRGEKGTHVSKFERTSFSKVHVFTENDTVVFSTKAELLEKFFHTKSLSVVPSELGGIFEVKHDDDCHVDFDFLLERSQLLHEDVLRPFLLKLKEHLDDVIACLKEVRDWLRESQSHIKFISATFDKELELPNCEALKAMVPTIVLKEVSLQYNYQITGTFDLDEPDEREVIEKMLEFVSSRKSLMDSSSSL